MMPFTRKIDPGLAHFLASTCRGIVVIAAVFSVAVGAVLVGSAVQVARVKPLDNPAMAELRERYRESPDDAALAADIRTLDFAARRLWFTREWQVRTAAWMLVVGAGVTLAALRAAAALGKRPPVAHPASTEGTAVGSRSIRIGLTALAVVLLAGGLTAAAWEARQPPKPPAQAQALPAAAAVAPVDLPAATSPAPAAPGTASPISPAPATVSSVVPISPAAAAVPTPPGTVALLTDEMKANWPQFRGPGGNGVAENADPPLDWDGPSLRNVAWRVDVPLQGRGSPAVWNGHVYLSGADATTREVWCWDTESGALLWKQTIPLAGSGSAWPPEVTADVGLAAPSVAANAEGVFAMFANGDLTALSHEGRILWSRHCGDPALNYGYAASPAVTADAVIVQFDQEKRGTLMALRATDGTVVWQTPREVTSSWSSPVVVQDGKHWIVLAQGDPVLAAYDAASGSLLWTAPDQMGENAPSPAYAAGRAVASNQNLSLSTVDVLTGKLIWDTYDDFPDVSSPLATADIVLMAASYGVVTCLDAAAGGVLWREQFPKGFYASPILAGGRLYLVDRTGVARIFKADRTKQLLGSPALGEPVDATPAVQGSALYIRSRAHLFRIEGKSAGTS
jgi:outer membrane protein assembly factor BamB